MHVAQSLDLGIDSVDVDGDADEAVDHIRSPVATGENVGDGIVLAVAAVVVVKIHSGQDDSGIAQSFCTSCS